MSSNSTSLCARDPVAVAVEKQLREMHADGYGELFVDEEKNGVRLTFGRVETRAENYDIAFVRLGVALLNDPQCGKTLTTRLRRTVKLAHC